MARTRPIGAPLLLAVLGLAGCAVGPDFRQPDARAPEAFRGETARADTSIADLAWWDVCTDPALRKLVQTALQDGFDARIAAARLEQSRAIAAQVHGQLFPGIGYAANADRGKNALLGNAYTQGGGSTASGFDGYLSAAWELDLWGRVRRLDEAARAQYLASEAGRRGVLLSLTAAVVSDYYQLLELDDELAIARASTASFADSQRLFEQRLQGGVASALESASAEAAMATSAARIPDIEAQIAMKENELSALVGANPGAVARGAPLEALAAPDPAPAGLPSELLERRPDVREAEEEARAANAGIGVTVGGFLPKIGLSAILGGVSSSLDRITTHKAGLWSVGANATGPLFQGGGLTGQYAQAKAAWEEAKLRYQQAALNAFADVANALVTAQKLAERRAEQEHAVRAYKTAVDLATQRYGAGRASYYEVLQAQQSLFPAEVALAQTKRDQFTAVVALYKALGGGWKLRDVDWTGAAPAR